MSDVPVIKSKFFDALKQGSGEAYLIMKNNPSVDFSSYIIKGAARDYTYDAQSEGSRAQYIFGLISLSLKKDKIRKAVIKELLTTRKEFWALVQLFEIAKMFAEKGDEEARKAIYSRFLSRVFYGGDWAGYQEILDLDGLNGLFFVAGKYGKLIARRPDYIVDDNVIRHFRENNNGIDAIKELKKAAKTNKYIRLYLSALKKNKSVPENKKPLQKGNDIIGEILKRPCYLSPVRIRKLNKAELNKIARALIRETDPQKIEKYLYAFGYRKFPLDNEFILRLAKQRSYSKSRIKEFATEALVFLGSENIRKFALDRIMKTRNPEIYARILVSNYRKGDYKLLNRILHKTKNTDNIHILAGSYTDIFTSNSTKECKQPLEYLYGKLNCGVCRNTIVKLLIKNNVLSKKIMREIRYDSNPDTRKLYKPGFLK